MEERDHWRLGTWLGIPVRMHWTVLIAFVWLYLVFWDLLATAIASVALFALFVAHEFGHVAVLRRRNIAIDGIRLNGIHGEVAYAHASLADQILAAWAGVGAQLLVLLAAWTIQYAIGSSLPPMASTVWGPIFFVWTKVNLILMVVALLPIGPFDGRAAWAVIPWIRSAVRRRRRVARENKMFPERSLSPERRRELEEASAKAAADLMGKLGAKVTDRKQDV
jgi:stage IV sporulation protein FB